MGKGSWKEENKSDSTIIEARFIKVIAIEGFKAKFTNRKEAIQTL